MTRPRILVKFECTDTPYGRAHSNHTSWFHCDNGNPVPMMFNRDEDDQPQFASPVGTVMTVVEPSGYTRTWTLMEVRP